MKNTLNGYKLGNLAKTENRVKVRCTDERRNYQRAALAAIPRWTVIGVRSFEYLSDVMPG
jgi:hypothetical protein